MRIAIVVGIDRLGKTELIEMMTEVKDRCVKTRKVVNDPRKLRPGEALERAEQEVAQWRDILSESGTDLLVYDRFPYPDEWVYWPLTTEDFTHGPSSEDMHAWDDVLHLYRVTLVYVEPPPWHDYLKRAQDDILDSRSLGFYQRITDSYEEILRRSQLRQIRIPPKWFTPEDAEELVERILSDG